MVSMVDHDLKMICWNVRGLNSVARREAVRLFLQNSKPTIICLQETKLDVISLNLAADFLGQPWAGDFVLSAGSRK